MAVAKQIIYRDEVQNKLVAGVNKLADAVVATLGPRGNNVAIDKIWGPPAVIHDGVSVAKEITLQDPFENMGAQLVKEAATKTNENAGDGTTTATLLAQQLIVKGMKNISAGANPIMLRRGMETAVKEVVKELDALAKKVTKKDWLKVATISAQDPIIGEKIVEAISLVGSNGTVEIEDGQTLDIVIDHKEGMEFNKGYASPYFVTDSDHMEAKLENPLILITDKKLMDFNELVPLLDQVLKAERPLVIIADDISGDALGTLAINTLRGHLRCLAIKAPGFGDRRKAMLEDIAILTNGTVITADQGLTIKDAKLDDLGEANSVRSSNGSTRIVGGAGSKADIKNRIAFIQKEIDQTTSDFDKEKLIERKAKLSTGVAVIKVGAATEVELQEAKERVKDAKEATIAAIEEGVVTGGGVAYLQASKVLNSLKMNDPDEQAGVNLVKEALQMPIRILAENSGADGGWVVNTILEKNDPNFGFNALTLEFGDMIKQGVIDPKKVSKQALLNAASVAGGVLTTRVMITEIKEDRPKVED